MNRKYSSYDLPCLLSAATVACQRLCLFQRLTHAPLRLFPKRFREFQNLTFTPSGGRNHKTSPALLTSIGPIPVRRESETATPMIFASVTVYWFLLLILFLVYLYLLLVIANFRLLAGHIKVVLNSKTPRSGKNKQQNLSCFPLAYRYQIFSPLQKRNTNNVLYSLLKHKTRVCHYLQFSLKHSVKKVKKHTQLSQ